jgi:hypothetical protein
MRIFSRNIFEGASILWHTNNVDTGSHLEVSALFIELTTHVFGDLIDKFGIPGHTHGGLTRIRSGSSLDRTSISESLRAILIPDVRNTKSMGTTESTNIARGMLS